MKESLGVELKDESLLRLALVHGSYLNENPGEFYESNQTSGWSSWGTRLSAW